MREISPVQNWLLLSITIAASGVLYDYLFWTEPSAWYVGATFAYFIGMPIMAFERGAIFRRLFRRIQKLPTPLFFLAELVIYEVLMSLGFAVANLLLTSLDLIPVRPWIDRLVMPFDVFIYALAVCAVLIFLLRVRELLGRDVFFSMLTSRYRNPVREERVFLFIDLVDSTAFAEKYGDLRAQQLLSSLFSTFAEPIRRHKGLTSDYVGDAAIITWPLQRGVKNARCVRCIFDILNEIDSNAATWRRKYGQVPKLRAALHGGPIITAEVGVDHHKISFFGDTVNTTARLEALCKSLNRQVLISADLAQRISLPDDIVAEDLGNHAVKGRGQTLGVMALASRAVTVLNTKAAALHG